MIMILITNIHTTLILTILLAVIHKSILILYIYMYYVLYIYTHIYTERERERERGREREREREVYTSPPACAGGRVLAGARGGLRRGAVAINY